MQPAPGRRTFIRAVTPLIENDELSTTVSIGTREQMTSTPTQTAEVAIGGLGYAGVNSDGRYHRVNISVPAGDEWRNASGYQVDFSVSGVY
jgi:hypothetical protein